MDVDAEDTIMEEPNEEAAQEGDEAVDPPPIELPEPEPEPEPTPEEKDKKKETPVLRDESLELLATQFENQCLVMGMYLCIPNTTLVNLQLESQAKGEDELTFAKTILSHWKQMKGTAKEKDKVHDLERALRYAGKQDIADLLVDRHKEKIEFTPDCFV